MCLAYLKKNRNWALWLSGFFSAVALSSLVLAIINLPLKVFGMTLDRNLYFIRFAVLGLLAYLLLRYWGKAQAKQRKRR